MSAHPDSPEAAALLTPASRAQMERFCSAHATQVLTILLSDLKGSTQQQAKLGNVRAAELVRAHRAVFREVLAGMDAQVVETAGDSFLVVFAAPSEGVKFALHMQAAMRRARGQTPELPEARVGIHQGQVVVERHAEGPKAMDIYGLQVSIAARIAELAQGGQALCSRAVFDDARAILRGPDLTGLGAVAWRNHGPYRFKGVEDAYDVCEVGEEGQAPLAPPGASGKSWPAGGGAEELGWRPAVGVLVPGTNWELAERLGNEGGKGGRFRGEFGEVWRARSPAAKALRAFKFCFKRDRVPALEREARLFERLRDRDCRHANLVEVYNVVVGERPPHYLEMEYVEGPSLDEWLAGGPPLGERLEVVAQVADALDTVHAAGIYHRDIKPSNILLTRRADGRLQAKLTDFGLGAAEDPDVLKSVSTSRVEGVAGTWDYIAPELREGGHASPQSDLYSLGLALLQIATGRLRAPAGPGWEQFVESEVLREDIARCMDPDPARRWGRAAELARALRSHDQRLRERQLERDGERQRRRARRLRAVAAVVGLFAAAMVLLGGYAWQQRGQARTAQKQAEEGRDKAKSAEQKARDAEDEARRQRDETRHQFGLALLERAKSLERDGRPTSAFLTAARAIGFDGYGGPLAAFPPQLKRDTDAYLCARGLAITNDRLRLWQSPRRDTHTNQASAIAFSPDGKTLATPCGDNAVRLWDAPTGQLLDTLEGHALSVACVSFSPDGRTLASGSWDRTIRLWDVATRKPIATLPDGHIVDALSFSPDGKTLASVGGSRTVRLWDTTTHQSLGAREGHDWTAVCVAFSPEGTTFASGGWDDNVLLWDIANPKPIATLPGHALRTLSVTFSPDGKTLASGGWANSILLWDVATRKPVRALEGHAVSSLAFSPDGTTLASGGRDHAIRLWDVATGKTTLTLEGHTGHISSLAFGPDGATLASASADQTIALWDVLTRRAATTLDGHPDEVRGLAFFPGGRTLASMGSALIRVWDVTTGAGKTLTPSDRPLEGFHSMCLSPDGRTLFTAAMWGGRIHQWDAATGELLASIDPLRAGSHKSYGLACSPDGKTLAEGAEDDRIRLWDLASGKPLATLEGHTSAVYAVTYSPDGSTLASAGGDKTVRLWDAATHKRLAKLDGHSDAVFCVAFSPNGKTLASGSMDKTIRLWDAAAREPLATLKGHTSNVSDLCFAPTGTMLVSGSLDDTVRLWDLATREPVAILKAPSKGILRVAISPDGATLAAGGWDRTIYLWRLRPPHKLPEALFSQFRFKGLDVEFPGPERDAHGRTK